MSGKVTVTAPLRVPPDNPDGSACSVRFAGVAPCAGLTLNQLPPEVTAAVKLTGVLGPLTDTPRTTGIVLPCVALKETMFNETVGGELTTRVTATCGVFEALGELIETAHG